MTPAPPAWLEPRLERAARLATGPDVTEAPGVVYLGVDLGTSDVVSMAVDAEGMPLAVCLAGALRTSIDEAQQFKHERGGESWPIVRPVFEKMTDIVRDHLGRRPPVETLYPLGEACALPGVRKLFAAAFKGVEVILSQPCLYLTPLAIASSARGAV